MNKRIKDFAISAGMVSYPTGLGINENTIWGDRNIELFASLIIQECVDKITIEQDNADQNWVCKNGIHIAHTIDKHFS